MLKNNDFIAYSQKALCFAEVIYEPFLIQKRKRNLNDIMNDLQQRDVILHAGDVVCGTHQDEIYIFDGEKLHHLYVQINPYGSIPPIKNIAISYNNHFHPEFWKDAKINNHIIWFDRDVLEGLTILERPMNMIFNFDEDMDVNDTDFIGYDRKHYWKFLFSSKEIYIDSSSLIKEHIFSGKCYFVAHDEYVEVWLSKRKHFDW